MQQNAVLVKKLETQSESMQRLTEQNEALAKKVAALRQRKSLKLLTLFLKEEKFFKVSPMTPKKSYSAPVSPKD